MIEYMSGEEQYADRTTYRASARLILLDMHLFDGRWPGRGGVAAVEVEVSKYSDHCDKWQWDGTIEVGGGDGCGCVDGQAVEP